MGRRFLACFISVLLAGSFFCRFYAFAFVETPSDGESLQISTFNSRPLSLDKLVYVALKDIGYNTSLMSTLVQTGLAMANDGDTDGAISYFPDIEQTYPNLRKVPVPLERTSILAFVSKNLELKGGGWSGLSGMKVGINTQRLYIMSQIPEDAVVTEHETTAQLMNGLLLGEYDIAILAQREHEVLTLPEGVVKAGNLEEVNEYLYLNKSRENLIPALTDALNNVFEDGRGEMILNNIQIPEANEKKTVLHIVSADTYVSREEVFRDKLIEQLENDTSIEWYTMGLNSRRFSRDPNRLAYFAGLLRQDCLSKDVAAIVISGDEAMEFITNHYNIFFRNVPVLFYGVCEQYEASIKGYEPYFTGIVENLSAYDTVNAALKLFPETKNIYVLNDYTTEGVNYRNIIAEQLEQFASIVNIEYNENTDLDSILERIKELKSPDSIVFAGSYFSDSNGQYYSLGEMKRLLERDCEAPIFTLYSTGLEYNAIGGKCLDYEAYGEIIAGMLDRLLKGENVNDIPIITDSTALNRWVFDKTFMDSFGIPEKSLPKNTQVLNASLSIWESDPRFALTLMVLFIMGIIIIVVMNANLIRYHEQKELLRSRQSLQTVLDLLPVPVRIVEIASGRILYINKATGKMFGLENQEQAFGQLSDGFMPPQQPDGTNSIEKLNKLNREESASAEFVCINADGEEFDCFVTACLIDYNGKKSSLGIMTNLSDEKEYRRMLKNTAEKEKEANQLKGRFLVNMSHEIRTPMNAVIGLTEIELQKDQPRETKEIYKKINLSAKSLLSIVNDILDLSKIEADKVELYNDEFELEEVIDSALLVATPRLNEKNVELLLNGSLSLPRFVVGDRTRLWQILKNFLDNSAKFTENGKIVMSVFENPRLSDDEKIYITFVIEDTGIGIGEEQMKKLFRPYEQVHNAAQKKYQGTGLGMAISKQLCELMGGSMQIESNPGSGTTIFVTIPFGRSKNSETEIQTVTIPMLDGTKILVVDDDAISMNIITKLLSSSNAEFETARNGKDVLEILRSRKAEEGFDLILIDYMMGGMDGIETAKQIQDVSVQTPRLLMLTAYQRMLLKQEIEESGIDGIVEKPLIPTRFIRRICMALSNNVMDEAVEEYTKFKDTRVLICEDHILNQEVAVGMFTQMGVESVVAENGRQGIEILAGGEKLDMVFMDLQMPVMDGYEATRIIREDTRFDHIPIISLTADAMKDISDKCIEIGMNDHLAKPMEFKNVHAMFAKWLPESKQVKEETATIPTFDSENVGLSRFCGDKAMYLRAISEMTKLLPEEWQSFNSAIKDIDETKRFLHKLKGAAGNLSEQELYRCAGDFESSLRAGVPDKDEYKRLIAAGHTFRKKAAEMIKDANRASAPAEIGDGEEFEQKLTALQEAIETYDLKKINSVCESLKVKIWPSVDAEKLDLLYGFMDAYDYDSACAVIASIYGE